MRIIPVMDLRHGRAVRGRSGDRASYRPVTSRLASGPADDLSDPAALLSAYRSTLRPDTVYVADLDRIAGAGDNDDVLNTLLASAPETRFLWDGGLANTASLGQAPRSDRVVPVIGTETLRSIEELPCVRRAGAPGRPVLSLDLRADGIVSRSPLVAPLSEEYVLRQALKRGFRTVIFLLLDRIGTSRGLPRERLRRLREAAPGLDLLAGGGIGSLDDLLHLRGAGFSGALLATALHDGLLSGEDLRREGFIDW